MSKHPLDFSDDLVDSEDQKEARYEDRIVSYLTYRYNLSRYKSTLLTAAQRRFGRPQLLLSVFLDQFPTFPVFLASAKIPYIQEDCSMGRLLLRMSTRKIIQRYQQTIEEDLVPEAFQGKPFGLVFPWPRVEHGLILHDRPVDFQALPTSTTKPTVRIVWTLPRQKRTWMNKRCHYPTPHLTIERLEQFVDNLSWSPEE